MKNAILCFSILWLSGCQTFHTHPWSTESEVQSANVEFIKVNRLSRVKPGLEEKAIKKLKHCGFISLDAPEYEKFRPKLARREGH